MNRLSKNRILSLFLALTIIFTALPISSVGTEATEATPISILYNGQKVDNLVLMEDEKITLTTSASGSDSLSYRWQICVDEESDKWVNIKGYTKDFCIVSYALIGSLLDTNGCAYLRCKATDGVSDYLSNTLTVNVSYNAPITYEKAEETLETSASAATRFSLRTANNNVSLAADDELQSCTIVINYTYEDNSLAFEPFVATIEYGGAFNYTAVSPTVVGYAPYILQGDTYVDAKNVELNYASLTEDTVIDVIYRPVLVDYTVRHYTQNILDDNYELHTETNGKQYTGSQVGKCEIDIDGFSALYYEHLTVAADGSTVIEVYYDRNYYLVDFDLGGGYGVDPIYARYGATIGANDPTRAGYVFDRWELVGVDGNAPTSEQKTQFDINGTQINIPNANLTYKAIWVTSNTTFTVVYWLENADDEDYSYWGSCQVDAMSNTVIDGENYKDYSSISNTLNKYEMRYSSFSHADADVRVEGDGSTVVNVYYDRNEYTLKFYYAMSSVDRGTTNYYVIGGSTYYFGKLAEDVTTSDEESLTSLTSDEVSLLNQYMGNWHVASGERGTVDELPTLNDKGKARGYTMGTDTSTVYGTTYTYYYISFTAKYGADISELWPCDVFSSVTRKTYNTHENWSGTEAFVSAWNGEHHVYYTQNNSNETIKGNYMQLDHQLLWDYYKYGDNSTVAYLCFWENGANIHWSVPKLFRYNIYVPLLDGQNTDGLTTKNYQGITYYLLDTYDTVDDSDVLHQTAPAITGYSYYDFDYAPIAGFNASLYSEAWDVDFYYSRNEYDLVFNNYGEEVSNSKVAYGTDISERYFAPDYPNTLEPNAYEFSGWYTTAECYPGTEFNFTDSTMPDKNLLLYAKWAPVQHYVKIYLDATLSNQIGTTQLVDHNDLASAPDEAVENGNYTFAGWFYVDEDGTEKAFVFNSMPINQDMNIYAKWSSKVAVKYEVYYKLEGTDTQIADPTIGSTLAGMNKTFLAKGGSDLYSDYQEGYFPTTNSHTVTMSVDGDNVFTFWYVEKESVPYTVRYIDEATGKELLPTKSVTDNKKAVVTEVFEPISGYMPDAYQKRLVLSANNADQNVITFYYTKDENHAYYRIVHYVQNLSGNGYTEYRSIESVGDIDTECSAEALTISGFEFKGSKSEVNDVVTPVAGTTVSGKLTANGLLIELFYDRIEVNYTVKYLENGTNKVLATEKIQSGIYGQQVSETYLNIDGYELIGTPTRTLTLAATSERNVIVFYYQEKNITIQYVPVGSGKVSIGSENVLVISGTVNGSVPTPDDGYKFVGWYLNEDCTIPVDSSWIDSSTGKILPKKNADGLYEEDIYYAKFEPDNTSLTIKKVYPADANYSIDVNQTFIFDIKGTSGTATADIDLTVTIHGDGEITITDLPIGTYTITEQTDWSWRYEPTDGKTSQTITLSPTETNIVTFENTRAEVKWLDGDSYDVNIFNGTAN